MDYSTVSLQELTRIEDLPESVEEACFSKQIFTLKELIDYWVLHGNFYALEGHSHTLEIVLSSVANKYASLHMLIKEQVRGEESLPGIIRRLNIQGKIILCQLIALTTRNYETRIMKLLTEQSWTAKAGEGLLDFLYSDRNNFLTSGAPAPTVSRIMELKNRISAALPLLAGNTVKGFTEARQKIHALMPANSEIKEFMPKKAVSVNGKIAVFKLIELLLESGFLFDVAEIKIFRRLYSNKTSRKKDLNNTEQAGPPNHPMRKVMRADLRSHFIFLSFLQREDLADYDLDLYDDILVLDSAFAKRINTREEVDFTRIFYETILSAILAPAYTLLDGISIGEAPAPVTKQKHTWAASYLVKKELPAIFNFNAFIEEVENINGTERAAGSTLDLDKLLSGFLTDPETRHIHRIRKTCLALLQHEFNLTENKQGQIVIPPSLGLHYKTILGKILEQLRLPASLPFLLARLKEIEPGLKLQASEIRSFLIADKDRFFCVGETDAFGLSGWRRSGKKFRTLSVEALATEFLHRAEAPMYIENILDYIRRFRLITPGELTEALRRSNPGIFILFKNDMIGLKEKNYAGEIVYISPVK